jgi:hypothetical protein
LNRTWWEKFKEYFVTVFWFKITGQKIKIWGWLVCHFQVSVSAIPWVCSCFHRF